MWNCPKIVDTTNDEVNGKSNLKTKTIYNKHKKTDLKSLMDVFDTGLPCQSSLLVDISNHSNDIIKSKTINVMVEYCEVILKNN